MQGFWRSSVGHEIIFHTSSSMMTSSEQQWTLCLLSLSCVLLLCHVIPANVLMHACNACPVNTHQHAVNLHYSITFIRQIMHHNTSVNKSHEIQLLIENWKKTKTTCEAVIQQQNQSNLITDLHIAHTKSFRNQNKLLKSWKFIQIQYMIDSDFLIQLAFL